MTRFRGIVGRLGRAEAARVANIAVPSVLRVGMNETRAEAIARFSAQWPNRPHDRLLIIPAKPSNPAEQALYEARLKASQLKLVAEARSNRLAIVKADQAAPHAPPKVWPTSPTIRPNGPHLTWKRNTHD